MRSFDCLKIVLAVRRRREEVEERALMTIGQEILWTRMDRDQLQSELAEIKRSRFREIQSVTLAVHHQSKDARNRDLQQQCIELDAKLRRLKQLHVQQMAVYMAARRSRELVGELEEQNNAAYRADRALREQKWDEDMFLARRLSNSDITISSWQVSATKE